MLTLVYPFIINIMLCHMVGNLLLIGWKMSEHQMHYCMSLSERDAEKGGRWGEKQQLKKIVVLLSLEKSLLSRP